MEKVVIRDSSYRLKRAKIIFTKQLTEKEKFFEIALLMVID